MVLLGVIVWWKDGDLDVAWLLGSLGGAAGGALVGAMVAVGLRAPRDPAAWDVHLVDSSARPRIAVTADVAAIDDVVAVLEREGATVEVVPAT